MSSWTAEKWSLSYRFALFIPSTGSIRISASPCGYPCRVSTVSFPYSTLLSLMKEVFMRIMAKWQFMMLKKVLKIRAICNLMQERVWNGSSERWMLLVSQWLADAETWKWQLQMWIYLNICLLTFYIILIWKHASSVTPKIKNLGTTEYNIIYFNVLFNQIAIART